MSLIGCLAAVKQADGGTALRPTAGPYPNKRTVLRVAEAALVDLRIHRTGGLSVPNFLVAPAIVAKTDLLATVPERVARTFAASLPLQVLEPPVPLPVLDVSLYWHERAHKDPLHRWMRDLVVAATRGV